MPPSSHWLIPLALFLLLGLAASLYIVKARLPHESRAAGLRMLGTLSWSDVVLLALAKPDLADRSDPPWLDEVCVHYDACEPTPTSQPDR